MVKLTPGIVSGEKVDGRRMCRGIDSLRESADDDEVPPHQGFHQLDGSRQPER